MNYIDYCSERYKQNYDAEYKKQYDEIVNLGRTISENRENQIEREAQQIAIVNSALETFQKYGDIDPAEIWKKIAQAHLQRKTNINISLEDITSVQSAHQSWNKSSGHAFERIVQIQSKKVFIDCGIKIVLQKELTTLFEDGKISNPDRDKVWVQNKINSGAFDLYCLLIEEDNIYVFGCVQAKTSIRDRVTRDREPSEQAMENYFWSVAIVLDGTFLSLPKFKEMVNGGGSNYSKNGWHGMYSISSVQSSDRIYNLSLDFELFKTHALQAKAKWENQRQWFNNE